MGPEDIEIKRMYSADDRRKMADSGDAMPDGSFPIADEEDLKNAISAYGRAKDPKAAKAHIMKRATDLDMVDMIPQDWSEAPSGKKANDAMDETTDEDMLEGGAEEKAVVKIGMDGEMTKCAKGLDGDACGYKAGSKVCGKCGAMAVETKSDDEDDIMYDTEIMRLDITDEVERKALRRLHLEAMGTKSADIEDGAFTCMSEQAVLPGGTAPCADCTGGCMGTKGLPDLAEVEAVATNLFGTVIDSGYSDASDRFVVAVERKDGMFEAHFDGKGMFMALVRLPEDWIADEPAVSADEAVTAAEAIIEGKALAIEAAVLDGVEVYSVEIEGIDGKSYDVFVDPMDGEVIAYDAYELSADDVEAQQGGDITVKSVEDPEFAAALMEFALLEVETDTVTADGE